MKEAILTSTLEGDWPRLVEWCEKNRVIDPNINRWSVHQGSFYAYCMEPDQFYDWHTDSFYLNSFYNKRHWARIIYLSHGAPIQFGRWDWSCKNGVIPYLDTGGWPIPDKVEHSVDVYPGLEIRFPTFYLHRVPYVPTITTNRWAVVDLNINSRSDEENELLDTAFNNYLKK